ncbi:MAG: hypothetical protein OXN79_06995 [bacterium]|nr:hypothetical protein [bacterium]
MRLERAAGYGALTSTGVLIAHTFGYLIAYSSAADRNIALAGHAYFGPTAWVIIPLASLLIAAVVVRAAARSAVTGFQPGVVSAATMGGFLALEVLERVPAGEHHAVLTEPGVVAGLALSLPVGWVLAKLARSIEHIVEAIVNSSRRQWSRHAAPAAPVDAPAAAIGQFFGLLPSPRGPPGLRVLTI